MITLFGKKLVISVDSKSRHFHSDNYLNRTYLFQLYAYDLDKGDNAIIFYYIQPPFRISEPLNSQLDDRNEQDPFTIGMLDGVIRTNIYFQENMQGYIEFVAFINDSSPEHYDRANVSVSV